MEDTIVAISTPAGEGGFGIVRMSGSQSISITEKIFKAKNKIPVSQVATYTVHYGHICDPNNPKTIVDEVLVSVYKSPKSYTCEDVVEISGHGGIVPLRKILELCLSCGARLAEPGEFTKRAFLNGRIDLVQAEAVCDIIRARTDKARQVAVSQLSGKLSQKIEGLRTELINLLAHLEAGLDHAEEDIDFISPEEKKKKLDWLVAEIETLLKIADKGKIFRDGLRVTIVGKPNVGKSSLLNTLLQEERAIVTPVPGTTRDVIEETININGIPVVLSDTAGMRDVKDVVESLGVERTRKTIDSADVVLFMIDLSVELSKEDYDIARLVKNKKVVLVANKKDLPGKISRQKLNELLPGIDVVDISVLCHQGINEVEKQIETIFFSGEIDFSEAIVISNLRHKESLIKTQDALLSAIKSLQKNMSDEFVAADLRQALSSIGEIVGETVTEDILERIFSQFCVGK